MKKPKYFIYKNTKKKCWSIKFKGLVINHCKNLIALDCKFEVSEKGRQRVLKNNRKNVHAYVTCTRYTETEEEPPKNTKEIFYDPYKQKNFIIKDTGEKVTSADKCYLTKDKVKI